MAGYTDSALRTLCKRFGADVVITELISSDAIFFQSKNWFKSESGEWQSKKEKDPTLEMLKFTKEERPIVIQLFGKNPEHFAFAAKWISENLKPDGIDINMGCPARKVVGSDHGVALLKNTDLAVEIVRAVKSNTNFTVSVKTRLGWESDDEILEFAPKLYSAGIDAIIIHGRTYKDAFKGKARWSNIYKIKELLPKLVVIGNGDIAGKLDQKELAKGYITLDGYAIGRATFGKPWVFQSKPIESGLLKKTIREHAELICLNKGEYGLVEFRKHLLAYLSGFSGAKELRKEAVKISLIKEVYHLIDSI